ncbi:MAG: response regulator [Solirubrobacterales bacterium]
MMDGARPIEILLVEDDPADVRLTREVLADGKVVNNLHDVGDGEEAMRFLRREGDHAEAPRPDVILLDLNLPKMDGREVLAEVKSDPDLLQIPVIALTTSTADRDIYEAYEHRVNAYISKPVNLGEFVDVVRTIESFWLTIVKLPEHNE